MIDLNAPPFRTQNCRCHLVPVFSGSGVTILKQIGFAQGGPPWPRYPHKEQAIDEVLPLRRPRPQGSSW